MPDDAPLHPGDRIELTRTGEVGTILEVEGRNVLVQFAWGYRWVARRGVTYSPSAETIDEQKVALKPWRLNNS